MSDEETAPEVEPAAETAAPAEPAQVTFTQEQVNAMLTKERNIATRKAKAAAKAAQPIKQEPTTSVEHDPAKPPEWAASLIQSNAEMRAELTATKNATEFTKATAGVNLSEADMAVATTLFEHNREAFDSMIKNKLAEDQPPAPQGAGVNGLPAPNPQPAADRETNPINWTKDDVAKLKASGEFLPKIKAYRARMPGGGGGLFPAKNPGKG